MSLRLLLSSENMYIGTDMIPNAMQATLNVMVDHDEMDSNRVLPC